MPTSKEAHFLSTWHSRATAGSRDAHSSRLTALLHLGNC